MYEVAGDTLGLQLVHGQPGESGALRISEHHDGILRTDLPAGDLLRNCGSQDLCPFDPRLGLVEKEPFGRGQDLHGAGEAMRLQVELVSQVGVALARRRNPAGAQDQSGATPSGAPALSLPVSRTWAVRGSSADDIGRTAVSSPAVTAAAVPRTRCRRMGIGADHIESSSLQSQRAAPQPRAAQIAGSQYRGRGGGRQCRIRAGGRPAGRALGHGRIPLKR